MKFALKLLFVAGVISIVLRMTKSTVSTICWLSKKIKKH